MPKLKSAKQVILHFSIGLNVVTILSLAMLSSGMFVANAKSTSSCISNLISSTKHPDQFASTYTGHLYDSTLGSSPIATLRIEGLDTVSKIQNGSLIIDATQDTSNVKLTIKFTRDAFQGITLTSPSDPFVQGDQEDYTKFTIAYSASGGSLSQSEDGFIHFTNGTFSGSSESTYSGDFDLDDTNSPLQYLVGTWLVKAA